MAREIKHGVRPTPIDHRDYSYTRTFSPFAGGIDARGIIASWPEEYNCDAGFGTPDQEADGLPLACTAYTQSELCQDEDNAQYKVKFTYDKTRMREGTYPQIVGCNHRDSMQSICEDGVQGINETTDAEAETHKRYPDYFNIDAGNGFDYFDAVRNFLWNGRMEKRPASIVSVWYPEWLSLSDGGRLLNDGLVPLPSSFLPEQDPWHNYKICGWKTILGQVYLVGKPWQGTSFGDQGWVYFSRGIFNAARSISGSSAFGVAKAQPGQIQTVQLSLLDTLISKVRVFIGHIFN